MQASNPAVGRASVDPRAARTQAAIKEAFEQMACEADAGRITVKELAERAGINRKTFYLHFETIEALFDETLGDVMDEFFQDHEQTPDVPEDIEGHARRFFRFLATRPSLVEHLVCRQDFYDFGDRLYRDQMARYRAAGDPFHWMGAGKEELVLSFIRTTALGFYRQWVREGKSVPVDEAADLVAHLTCCGVGGLMR